mgnify:CR=1 FL=1
MQPRPTKGNAPTAGTVEASSANPPKPIERTNKMDSIAHPLTVPALCFSLKGFQLRVFVRNDEPLFVLADVCALLGIKNPSMALKSLDADEVCMVSDLNTLSSTEGNRAARGNPNANLVTESGFYTLILRCRDAVNPGSMPHRVRRWVTGEVLPSIRKTGSYSVKRQVPFDRQIARCQSLVLQIVRCDDVFGRNALIQLARVAYAEIGQELPDVSMLPVLVSAQNGQASLVLEGAA